MHDELAALHADLLGSVLAGRARRRPRCSAGARAASWRSSGSTGCKEELAAAGPIDLAMLSVATSELRSLV